MLIFGKMLAYALFSFGRSRGQSFGVREQDLQALVERMLPVEGLIRLNGMGGNDSRVAGLLKAISQQSRLKMDVSLISFKLTLVGGLLDHGNASGYARYAATLRLESGLAGLEFQEHVDLSGKLRLAWSTHDHALFLRDIQIERVSSQRLMRLLPGQLSERLWEAVGHWLNASFESRPLLSAEKVNPRLGKLLMLVAGVNVEEGLLRCML